LAAFAEAQVVTLPLELDEIDFARLREWLAASSIVDGEISDAYRLKGGTQNLLVRFRCGDQDLVLRRPPPDKPSSLATVRREAVVLSALAASDVPHPALRGMTESGAIAGGAFLVTDAVRGFNATVAMPGGAGSDPSFRHAMGIEMVDALAKVAKIAVGTGEISELGNPDGFLQRQAGRWAKQLASYTEFTGWDGPAALGAVEEIGVWLNRNLPDDFHPGLMHGDYHIANVLFDEQDASVAAILDWELATIGDPLLDFARLLTVWPDQRGKSPLSLKVYPWAGFPTKQELIERYVTKTGRSMKVLPWFMVLACYKYAIILEGTHARAQAGLANAGTGTRLHNSSVELMRQAVGIAGL
jgi:aminoglycoside phosphotransferase (APT) family kinase protein